MGARDLLRRVLGPSTAVLAEGASTSLAPRSRWSFLLGEDFPTRAPLADEATALAIPPFGRAVSLIANAVADTEWHAVRWDADAGVAVRLANQPSIVTDPDPESTAYHYRWRATEDGILYGNHFALLPLPDATDPRAPDWMTGRPGYVVPLPADAVALVTHPDLAGWWTFTVDGTIVDPYPSGPMLHVAYGSRSGEVLGRGALRQYGQLLGNVNAAEDYSGGFFAGGALPPAVLSSPHVLGQDQADELKRKWREMSSTREPVILPTGYTLTPIVTTADQSQLVEARTFNAQLVAMILGIPSYKLGLPGATMTYETTETADIDFMRDTVTRYASPLAAVIGKRLLPLGQTLRFDYAGRMRADRKTQSDVLSTLTTAKILSIDEARVELGRAPLPPDPEPVEVEVEVEPGLEPQVAEPELVAAVPPELAPTTPPR